MNKRVYKVESEIERLSGSGSKPFRHLEEILMHLRSLKKSRKDVPLHDPMEIHKEGNEISLIDVLGTEVDVVVDEVQLKIEKSKIYNHLHILDDREKEIVIGRFGLVDGMAHSNVRLSFFMET